MLVQRDPRGAHRGTVLPVLAERQNSRWFRTQPQCAEVLASRPVASVAIHAMCDFIEGTLYTELWQVWRFYYGLSERSSGEGRRSSGTRGPKATCWVRTSRHPKPGNNRRGLEGASGVAHLSRTRAGPEACRSVVRQAAVLKLLADERTDRLNVQGYDFTARLSTSQI